MENRWTGFHEQFVHASTNRVRNEEEIVVIMATLMAMGTNVGLTKMDESTPGISYRQMANAAQWRLYEDAMNKSQAVLVNFHHRLSLPSYWGDGTTSSSDGMRVQIGVSDFMQMPILTTELGKVRPFTVLSVTSFRVSTPKSLTQTRGMRCMLMGCYTTKPI